MKENSAMPKSKRYVVGYKTNGDDLWWSFNMSSLENTESLRQRLMVTVEDDGKDLVVYELVEVNPDELA